MTDTNPNGIDDSVLTTVAAERAVIQRHIRKLAEDRQPLRVLEAGCGRQWPMAMDDVAVRITGVDMDELALKHRTEVCKDLEVAIHGDIRTAELEPAQFDLIYSAYVLEHIDGVAKVLDNFQRWLAPGGMLILRIPDRDSAFAFVSRFTPLWFHVLYYRLILGRPNAGKPGFAPYPVCYDPAMSSGALRQFASRNGLEIVEQRKASSLPPLSRFVSETISLLSLRTLSGDHNNLLIVMQKTG